VLLLDLSQDTSASVIYLRGSCQTEEEKKNPAQLRRKKGAPSLFFFLIPQVRELLAADDHLWPSCWDYIAGSSIYEKDWRHTYSFLSSSSSSCFLNVYFFFTQGSLNCWQQQVEKGIPSAFLCLSSSLKIYIFCACVCVFFYKKLLLTASFIFFFWYLACSFNYVLLLYLLVCEVNTDDERKKKT